VETKATCMVLTRRLGVVVAMVMWIDFSWVGIAAAEKVRIVMPSKSMTYMNFYVGEKVGLYKARKQGLRTLASLPDLGIEFLQLSTVTSRGYARSHPQVVRQYLKAQVEAIAWLKDENHRQEAQQILGSFLRNQDRELLDNMYDSLVRKVFRPAPYATAGGAQNILEQIALSNPKAKQAKAQDFIDDRFLRELEQSGFIKGLYQR